MTRWLRRLPPLVAASAIGVLVLTGLPSAQTAVTPFRIRVPDSVLTDLRQRLARARVPAEIENAGWDYGTSTAYLKTLLAYWRDRYDWRSQERRLNQFAQFTTTIDGIPIHFVHQRSKVPGARPLLLLNGWPSSLVEYLRVIGPLTDPQAHGAAASDAYHVVIPDMPGFGFSGSATTRGMGPERVAGIWAELMARLGYDRYAVHGSDWGFVIGTRLAVRDPAHVSMLHLETCQGAPDATPRPTVPAPARVPFAGSGYYELHSTKPQTLAVSLSDSPVGLLSWIVEKWHAWSDHAGDVETVYTKDDLLTNVMLYWVTNTGPSSIRMYYEARHPDGRLLPVFTEGLLPPLPAGKVSAPTGCALFTRQFDNGLSAGPADLAAARRVAETRYNVVRFERLPRGGHFAALEQPDLWVDELRAFLREWKSGPAPAAR
jgi:pimeloyl-ACP methyl ester carboxylesterase